MDASRMSSVAVISNASVSCGVVTATRTASTVAMKKTVQYLPRDPSVVTASSPVAPTNNVSRRAITVTWNGTVWTAATNLDAVSVNEYLIVRDNRYFMSSYRYRIKLSIVALTVSVLENHQRNR